MFRIPATRLLVCAIVLAVARPSPAQKLWLGSNTDDNWSTSANWTGGIAPGPGPDTWLRFYDSSHRTPFADGAVPWVLNRVDFGSPGYPSLLSFTISGGSLSFSGVNPTIRSYSRLAETINNNIDLPGSNLTIDGGSSELIKLNGQISGQGGVVVTGQAAFSHANTYTGPTQLGSGPTPGGILLTHGDALAASSGTTVNGGSLLTLGGGIDVRAQPLLLAGGTLRNVSGSNTWSSDIDVSPGATISSDNPGDTLRINGTIDGRMGSLQVRGRGNVTLAGTIKNLPRGVSRWDSGTLTLEGPAINVASFEIPDGKLIIAAGAAIPSDVFVQLNPSTGNIYVPAYPTLVIQQDTMIGGLSCDRSSLSSGGIASVQLENHRLTVNQSGNSQYNGSIAGTGGLVKDGVGLLQLSGVSSFLGGTTIKGGKIVISGCDSLGPAPATPMLNVTLDGGILEGRAYDQSFYPASLTFDVNRTIYMASTGGLAGTYKPFIVPSLITGPGRLVIASGALVSLSNPKNDFSGGLLISSGAVQFDNIGAMGSGTASVEIRAGASAIAGYPLEQSFLAHLTASSAGLVVLGVDSDQVLDFAAAQLTKASLDVSSGASFGGVLTGSPIRLGGRVGSDFVLSGPSTLSGSGDLEIVADGASGGRVTFANNYTVPGRTTVRSGTLKLASSTTLTSAGVDIQNTGIMSLVQSTLDSPMTLIDRGGTLAGCGTVTGEVTNNGTLTISGCELRVRGNITNNGTLTITGAGNILTSGSFINNGVVDLMSSSTAQLPADFINNGIVYDATHAPQVRISPLGPFFLVTVDASPSHSYVLQRSLSLERPIIWENIAGPNRPNTAGPLTFYASAASPRAFFRVNILP